MRRKGRKKRSLSVFTVGIIGIVVIVVFSYLAYTKFANPFASQYTVHAVFANATGLRPDSLVRIAGVNVGKVETVEPVAGCKPTGQAYSKCQESDVTMTIQSMGLPLHKDATFAVRPRIFLEGNFFIDVHPGTPQTGDAPDGYTFPIQQGTEPVQLDQVLTSLQSDTRKNLQILLQQYGGAVKKAGPSYNRSIQFWLPAYEYTAIVAHDALGIQPHDLSNWIAAQGTVSGAVDAHPQNLKNLLTDFNTTAGAFARENVALQQAVAELPTTLSTAIPTFNALNASFPPLRTLAHALIPGVVSTGPMVDKSLPFVAQVRALVQPSELRGLASDLSVTIPALAKLTVETIPFMRDQVRPASSCIANVVMPWTRLTIHDQHFNSSNGFPEHPVYVEAVDFLPGLAGESRDFDANGPYIRVLGTGGTLTYSLQPGLFGQSLNKIIGVQPQLPPGGHRPPLEPKVPCETQHALTTLDTSSGTAPNQIASASGDTLSAPGSQLRQQSAAVSALGAIRDLAKSEGVSVKAPSNLNTKLK